MRLGKRALLSNKGNGRANGSFKRWLICSLNSLLCCFCSCVYVPPPQSLLHQLHQFPVRLNLPPPCLVRLALRLLIPGNGVWLVVPRMLQKSDAHSMGKGCPSNFCTDKPMGYDGQPQGPSPATQAAPCPYVSVTALVAKR